MSNINFNSKTAKNFRVNMANYYNAIHKFNDFVLKRDKDIKACKQCLATDNADIMAMGMNTYNGMRTLDEIKNSIATLTSRLDVAKNEYDSAKELCDNITKSVETYVSVDLYNAYVSYVNNIDSNELCYAHAICEYLKSWGIEDATDENCVAYTRFVTRNKGTKSSKFKTRKCTAVYNRKQYTTIFVGAFCDYLVDANIITPYKYEYVLEKATK